MSYSREMYLLSFARGLHIAAEESGELVKENGVFIYRPGPYTIKNDACDCTGFQTNLFKAATERQGQEPGEYPGVVCKHVFAVQLVEERIGMDSLGELSPADKAVMAGGFLHQANIVKERNNPTPVTSVTGRRVADRVPAVRIDAKEGYTLDLGNGRTSQYWTFGLNGLTADEALTKAQELYGEGFTPSIVQASEAWAATLTPIA